ncbi:MAG: glycosyltransferase family 4 protein, partial [Planctomycetota bacterium]
PDADVVIGTWWETAVWMNDFPAAKGAKVHFIQHDETQFDHHEENYRERVEATWKLPLHRVVVASWLKDLAAARYGVSDVSVVPNGVDIDLFHAPPRTKRWPTRVGMMYASSHFKGIDITLEAVRLARQAFPKLQFVAFGAHQPMDELPVPHPAEYHVAPEQDKLREIYASCDAWLFGSRSEGFGLPVLEAMACRTPVIGTPTGIAPDVLGNGAGIFVKPQDPLDMAKAIERVCRMQDAEWKRMSDKSYAIARKHTWPRSYDAFETELKKAVAGRTVAA